MVAIESSFNNQRHAMTEEITNTEDAVNVVSDVLDLDVQQMKDDVDKVIDEELYWFPVRHHSPCVAKYLQQAIKERKPKIIFIEGPHEATHLIPHILDKRTKPPVAVYSSYRDANNSLGLFTSFASFILGDDTPARFASWYPMMSYSPEYVAIEASKDVDAEVVFMDLPHWEILGKNVKRSAARMGIDSDDIDEGDFDEDDFEGMENANRSQTLRAAPTTGGKRKPVIPKPASGSSPGSGSGDASDEGASGSGGTDSGGGSASGDGSPGGTVDGEEKSPEEALEDLLNYSPEELIVNSSFYQTLAKVAGYHSWDECWDTMFEIHEYKSTEEFRKEFALFCRAVRSTTTDREMEWDGTLDREKFMIKTINETLEEKKIERKDAMVVCGGFHIFLDREAKDEEPLTLEGTTYVTVVPYSYFRMSETSGYGAGNRAPRFYQVVWDALKQKQKSGVDTTLSEHIVDIIKEARKLGEPLSSADAIASLQHAELLSRLRGRPQAILDDIHDAVISCCCKGNPSEDGINLYRAMNQAGVGTAVGKVTPDIGRLPIIEDFYKQVEKLELEEQFEKDKRAKLKLDKRTERDAERSAFLHRLTYLEVPAATFTGTKADFDSGKIFGEEWVIKWGPEIEAKLIEQNLYGDTIEAAAISRLKVSIHSDDRHAGSICRKLLAAIEMDLSDLVQQCQDQCGVAIDEDSRFTSLCDALSSLMVLDKYADLRELNRDSLIDLIVKCFDRACFSILDVVSAPTELQTSVVNALTTLAEAVLKGTDYKLDKALFTEHVQYAYENCTVPFLKGVFFGMLLELREKTSEELAQEILGLTRSPVDIMITAGDFLDGVMSVSRTSILIGAEELIGALDELLKKAQWENFLSMLPRLRAAFDHLHEGQRCSLAEQVAKKYGLVDAASITEFITSSSTAVELARIDAMVAEIMKEWAF